jgi:hypothetical protein
MKYISKATERLKAGSEGALNGEPSLIERVLKEEKDEKLATIMALDLMLVGIDTISMATSSILYQLATRPAEQQKMFEELQRNMPDPDAPLTYQMLDQNKYTKAFIKEVLRLYSTVIGNGRTLQRDTVICGYKIPKGVQVVFPNLVVGTDDNFVSDATEFKPERWMKSDDNDMNLHKYASLPYGEYSLLFFCECLFSTHQSLILFAAAAFLCVCAEGRIIECVCVIIFFCRQEREREHASDGDSPTWRCRCCWPSSSATTSSSSTTSRSSTASPSCSRRTVTSNSR